MKKETYQKQQQFAGEKKPSMKRRFVGHDYTDRLHGDDGRRKPSPTLYDATTDKVAQATIGELKEGDKTGAAVKTIKLLAQSTGDYTHEELKKDVKMGWTDKAKAEILAAKGGASSNASQGGGSSSTPTSTNNGDEPGEGD